MPAAQATATQNTITLKGSTQIVTEFFNYAVNSILFQRGLYDPENFERKKKYGLSLMVTSDDGLVRYLDNVMTQISECIISLPRGTCTYSFTSKCIPGSVKATRPALTACIDRMH